MSKIKTVKKTALKLSVAQIRAEKLKAKRIQGQLDDYEKLTALKTSRKK